MIKMVDIKTINTIYTTIYKSNGTKTMVCLLYTSDAADEDSPV